MFRQSWDAFVGILETEAETGVGGGRQAVEPSGRGSRMGARLRVEGREPHEVGECTSEDAPACEAARLPGRV